MSYGTIYRLEFSDVQNRDLRLDILKKDYSGGVDILTGTDRPVVLGSLNNDEDKFSPIRGQRLIISLVADGVFSLDSIYSEADDAFMVEFYRDEEIVFIGFLVQDDCREDYQDAPYVVTLEAVDGLGLLKDIPLVNHAGNKFDGKENIAGYLLGALKQTGLDIPIRMYFNLVEESFGEGWHAFQETFVDAETWKKNDTEFMSCYEVLEKIMISCGCILFQAHGRWNVVRVKELQKETLQWRQISSQGVSNGTETAPAGIGQGLGMIPVNMDQIKSLERPYKSVSLTFGYDYPEIIAENTNLLSGVRVPSLDEPSRRAYELSGWTQVDINLNPSSSTLLRSTVYADINNRNRQEGLRYVEMVPFFSGSSDYFMKTQPFPVQYGDSVTISLEHRTKDSVNTSLGILWYVAFIVEGQSQRFFLRADGKGWTTSNSYMGLDNVEDRDSTEWVSFSRDAEVIPVSGVAYLVVSAALRAASPGNVTAQYRNIKLSYSAFSGGSAISGHRWDVSQNKDIKNTTEREVFLSDSDRSLIKGTLFRNDKTTRATLWHERGDPSKKYDFMEAAALGIYNAYFRRLVKMEGSFRGLDNDNEEEKTISLMNMFYFLTMPGRFFIPLSIQEIDFRNMIFRAYLAEHRSELSSGEPNLNGDQQADSREFSYTYENAG